MITTLHDSGAGTKQVEDITFPLNKQVFAQ